MAVVHSIRGVKQVIANLRKKRNALRDGCERGVKLAAAHLLRESRKKVPVDYGALKASGFVRTEGKGFNTTANVGYTALYAIYVHENLEMKLRGQPRPGGRGRYWDPQGRGQSKFLEEPARTEAAMMRKIIRESTRIRG